MTLPRLRDIRRRELLTQAQLAARAGVGEKSVQRAERGEPVAFSTVQKLATVLGVAPRELTEPPATG